MVPAFLIVLVDQLANAFRFEQAAGQARRVEQRFAQQGPQFAAEPIVQRYAEAHLGPRLDRRRQQILKGLDQNPLAAAVIQFQLDRRCAASSATLWSRKGQRHSRLYAMLAISTLFMMSQGK